MSALAELHENETPLSDAGMLNFGDFMEEIKPGAGVTEKEFELFERALLDKLERGKAEHGETAYLCSIDKIFTYWQEEFLDQAGYPFLLRNRGVPKEVWEPVKARAEDAVYYYGEIEKLKQSLLQ